MDPTGGEEVQTGIRNKLMRTRMPRLKNQGSLVRSSERENIMAVGRRTTPQWRIKGREKTQSPNMTIIRGNTLTQSDGKDQSNHPNNHHKRSQAQRREPVAKMTLIRGEHLRILQAKVEEAQEGMLPFRPEGGEEQTIKTTNLVRGAGTRCQRAKKRRQV